MYSIIDDKEASRKFQENLFKEIHYISFHDRDIITEFV